MVSPPSPDTPHPTFERGIHWEVSPPFRVQWLSKTSVEFFRIGHLKNALNEGLAVLVGKDGQEVEEGCGRELVREMFAFAEAVERGEVGEQRGGGGGGGGGERMGGYDVVGYGGGRKFGKREGSRERW